MMTFPSKRKASISGNLKRLLSGLPLIEALCILAILFIYLPILVLITFSFNDASIGIFPLQGFTLKWYLALVTDTRFLETTRNSLYVAAVTTVVSCVLGIAAAFGIAYHKFRLKKILARFYISPFFLPGQLLGIALLSFFAFLQIRLSLFTVMLSHIVISIPFFYLILSARLQGIDRSIEEAARDLGANNFQAFWRITLPMIRPSIVGSAIIVFATSMDNFIVSFFTIGADSTLPILIWSMLRRGVSPSVNAVSTILLVVTFTAAVAVNRFVDVKLQLV
ncbi:ABC transporter permease [Acidobacteria bacterium AH-259-G07]|nr:ABC transporter permease [Acidobacteria bacterium AH-259-G07]